MVLLTLALVAMAADSQNRYAIKSAQHLANSALRAEVERLEGFVGDYAFWNDSALNLVSEPAPTWTTENIGPDVIEGLRMTASLVIDGQGRATYAAVDGAEFGPEVTGRLSSELDNLVRAARDGVGGAGVRPERASTVLLLDGNLAIAAASAITWDEGRSPPLAAGAPATLVFVRRMDETRNC
ncbi:MAG TPA: CHASE4 domain-containing protein [Thalassobaculum sp.]